MREREKLAFARTLRTEPTAAEAKLWLHLRAKRFGDFKFRRQTVVGPYICDFTCRSAMLVIEVDGHTHGLTQDADARRTEYLQTHGWHVVRFTNAEIMGNVESVLEHLKLHLHPPLPDPLP
ncbi:MAG: DUF559 domain-containing protein [Pseudomonadota bacterium]|jgi:very-short-patch-repair endonuclease